MRKHAKTFIETIDKSQIDTILLSGSVSRGDYCPGKKGGAIDLIVMKKDDSNITVEELFGKNENPDIPYHNIKWNGEWFQILFTDFIDCNKFKELNEPRKFSIMESKIFYDHCEKNRYIAGAPRISIGTPRRSLAAIGAY
jgi:hypothetical protein